MVGKLIHASYTQACVHSEHYANIEQRKQQYRVIVLKLDINERGHSMNTSYFDCNRQSDLPFKYRVH